MFLLEFVTIQFFPLACLNAEIIQGIRRRKVKTPINRLLVPAKTLLSRQTYFCDIPKPFVISKIFFNLSTFVSDILFYSLLSLYL